MKNNTIKRILSGIMATTMTMSLIPTASFAAQSNEYVDPADRWVEANGRTDELDINATTTYETFYCPVCDMDTTSLVYRVPEYTKSGDSALNREVMYSDGTKIGGEGTGNVDSGIPGVDAYYSGYHWTKAVCQNCGVMNSVNGIGCYSFGKNVYIINSCDYNFFLDFDNTTYTPYNSKYHTTVLKKGQYCQFCKGTHARATNEQELHDFDETVDAQLGNQRFHISGTCEDCGYIKDEYAVAKSVVESYYGKVDGKAHTVTVSDLSEDGVNTSIRYGTEAGECDDTSAPNYTDEGYYPVYYEITYSYDGTSMTENGVSYVWLLDADKETATESEVHTHDYRYLETVRPTCTELGYDRFQCNGCGALQKANYVPSSGHDYDEITIREASCQQGGFILNMCSDCGDHYTENTSMTDHDYYTNTVVSTCTMNGYTEHICEDCGYKYITDLTPLAKHDYSEKVTEATCKTKGFTTYTCENCDHEYVSDYTDATGHDWDAGHTVTNSTCESEGVIEYHCENCDEKMIAAESATGHMPGAEATCTQAQTCEECDAVLEMPTGHNYTSEVTESTCTASGYTTYTCESCGHEYITDYTDKTEHSYNTEVTEATCTAMGYTTYICADCGDNYVSDHTDKAAHNYNAEVKAPTCTEMGYTTYTCLDCGDSYISDYTEVLPHNYNKQTIEPTCTSQGYTIYTCPDCGKEYIGDEKESTEHEYTAVVTASTCTEMGYTTYTCKDCDESYVVDYTEALGHSNSEWIIDIPATIEHAGEKHIECTVCGTTLKTEAISQLIDKDNSDEDGNAQVGRYSIVLTDKDNKPVFNSEITIDVNDNITINLPDNRLLDYADRTTVTVFITDTQEPVEGLNIFIYDMNSNATTGKTDANGQLVVPSGQSSTGSSNGTVGGEDEDKTFTYVVTVTDKEGVIISNCDVAVDENNGIVVKLPDGVIMDSENRVTVTVTDHNGTAQPNINVTVIDDKGNTETGITNADGKVTLPDTSKGITDSNGQVVVNGYHVTVENKTAVIPNAVVEFKDGKIYVTLPDTHTLTTSNQTTVTVVDKDSNPVKGMSVKVTDKNEKAATKSTNSSGKITVPVKSSGGGGGGSSSGGSISTTTTYNVKVVDKDGKTISVTKSIKDDKITLTLPSSLVLDGNNYYTITVTDKSGKAKSDIDVTLKDKKGTESNGTTDKNGQLILPAKEHKLYVVGYEDGEFKPEGNMTRAEAATIFARNIVERKDENISSRKSSFTDVSTSKWYSKYIAYLEKYDIIEGYNDDTFKPEEQITRAEFVTMCTRFYKMFDEVGTSKKNIFNDVTNNHWASGYIYNATEMDWIKGYADGTFRPDNNITRAEVVAIVNRVIGCEPDTEYINKNMSSVNKFIDLKDKSYWAFYEIISAANTHMAVTIADGETWVK